jgi:hypothetical protein
VATGELLNVRELSKHLAESMSISRGLTISALPPCGWLKLKLKATAPLRSCRFVWSPKTAFKPLRAGLDE